MHRRVHFIRITFAAALLFFLPALSHAAETPDRVEMIYGPGIEIGIGMGANLEGEERPWNSDSLYNGTRHGVHADIPGAFDSRGTRLRQGRNSDADTLTYGDYGFSSTIKPS